MLPMRHQEGNINENRYILFSIFFGMVCYVGMELVAFMAAVIGLSKGFEEVQREWGGRFAAWGNLTDTITESFCCQLRHILHLKAEQDPKCSSNSIYSNSTTDITNFSLANQAFNADKNFFINGRPFSNYVALTTPIPIVFGILFYSSLYYWGNNQRCPGVCFQIARFLSPLILFLIQLPYLFVVFDLGQFNTLSGALTFIAGSCRLPYNSSGALVENVFNQSVFFDERYYQGNDSHVLFAPVILLQVAAVAMAYYVAFLINRARRVPLLPLVGNGEGVEGRPVELQPLLAVAGQEDAAANPMQAPQPFLGTSEASRYGTMELSAIAAEPPRQLSYQEKMKFIEKHDPDFLSSQRALYPMLLCPITLDIMIEPICASDGCIYERSAFYDFLQSRGRKSPCNRTVLTDTAEAVQNQAMVHPIRSMVTEILDRKYNALLELQGADTFAEEYARLSGIFSLS
jgi:hypothetical protein